MKTALTWASAAFAFIAAYYWFRSTTAVVLDPDVPIGASAYGSGDATVNGIRLGATAKLQGLMNRRAALAAGVSALLQGITLLL